MCNKPNQNAQLHVQGPWDKLKEKEDHSKEFERHFVQQQRLQDFKQWDKSAKCKSKSAPLAELTNADEEASIQQPSTTVVKEGPHNIADSSKSTDQSQHKKDCTLKLGLKEIGSYQVSL